MNRKTRTAVAAIIVIVLIGIVASVVVTIKNNQSSTTPVSNGESTETIVADEQTTTSQYTDGTYSASGSYLTPGGRQSIALTVTIRNGVIVETGLVQNASGGESKEYQEEFADNYESLVIGKSVDSVKLSRVAGSSLTSNGFNNALAEIKADAKA